MAPTDTTLRSFDAAWAGDVALRVRLPERRPPHTRCPVLVFLHGGAEAGTDNVAQLTGTFGVLALAERYPDHLIIAPQATPSAVPLMSPTTAFDERVLDPAAGWNRRTLGNIAEYIRGVVDDGVADPDRIFLTGVSMGGAGTLRMLDVAPDLFAGAVAVCPTMTPETYALLRGLGDPRLWIATSYIDHTPDRHAYIVAGILALVRAGARDVHLSIYTPAQLAEVGVGAVGVPISEELLRENHSAWELTYRNAEGILDWLTTRRKEQR